MDITEVETKTALIRSRIPGVDFVINPYTGCGHGCRYCYATFMSKYSRTHKQGQWGQFVEVKANIVEVLRRELARKRKRSTATLSSVCDPYQPAETRYRLTRGCITALQDFGWGVDILTRSPLVTRDMDLLRFCMDASVGFSIPTDNDNVRRALEPASPPIPDRVEALRRLHESGIRTWAFIAPMLPMNPERLAGLIMPHIDFVMMDALNYPAQVSALLRRHGWERALTGDFARTTRARLIELLGAKCRA